MSDKILYINSKSQCAVHMWFHLKGFKAHDLGLINNLKTNCRLKISLSSYIFYVEHNSYIF